MVPRLVQAEGKKAEASQARAGGPRMSEQGARVEGASLIIAVIPKVLINGLENAKHRLLAAL